MKRAFVFYGGWEGHEPAAFAELARNDLAAAGLEVTLADRLDRLADAAWLRGFDLIVPIWTMGELAPDQERGLTRAVAEGVGLAGWHGGMGDAFRKSAAYQFVVGGQFVAHPGDIRDYRVEVTRPEHPIMAGLEGFAVHSEQYYLHVDPCNEILATTTFDGAHAPWTAGCVMPVAWTRRHGRGRVFYSSLGHVAAEFDVREVREIARRGMLWAAGADVSG